MSSNKGKKLSSHDIITLDKGNIVNTYARNQLVITEGKGAECFSSDGKKFIDFTAGIGVNSLGFCDDKWIDAVTQQLKKLQHVSNLFYTEPQCILANELVKKTGMSAVLFVNSGAEANEAAIKTARKYGTSIKGENVNRIITLKNSFHGRTMVALTATGQDKYHRFFTPFPQGFDYCSPNHVGELQQMVCGETCAIMIEVIQGEGGVINLTPEFVETIADICIKKGILLIVDEVQTGIGRTGRLFAYEHYGIEPDIVSFAKGLGGGLPIGGIITGNRCSMVLQPGDHGSTFGGNPAICSGAIEVLKTLDGAFLKEVTLKGEYAAKKLSDMKGVDEVSGKGLMLGISVKGKNPSDIVEEGINEGLLLLSAGDKIRMLPPLNIEWGLLEKGLNIMETLI